MKKVPTQKADTIKQFNIPKDIKDILAEYKDGNKVETVEFKKAEIKVMRGSKNDKSFLQPCPADIAKMVDSKRGTVEELQQKWNDLLKTQLLSKLKGDDDKKDDDDEDDADQGRQKKSNKKILKASKSCEIKKTKSKTRSAKKVKRSVAKKSTKSKSKSKSKSDKKPKRKSKSDKKPKKVTKK